LCRFEGLIRDDWAHSTRVGIARRKPAFCWLIELELALALALALELEIDIDIDGADVDIVGADIDIDGADIKVDIDGADIKVDIDGADIDICIEIPWMRIRDVPVGSVLLVSAVLTGPPEGQVAGLADSQSHGGAPLPVTTLPWLGRDAAVRARPRK
jgi:hypothetical protein